jgi:hypothetical protein
MTIEKKIPIPNLRASRNKDLAFLRSMKKGDSFLTESEKERHRILMLSLRHGIRLCSSKISGEGYRIWRKMDEAPPVAQGIEKLVCSDILKRQLGGIKKYGFTVAENPAKLKEWLNHAYEEALDMAIYLRRAMSDLK